MPLNLRLGPLISSSFLGINPSYQLLKKNMHNCLTKSLAQRRILTTNQTTTKKKKKKKLTTSNHPPICFFLTPQSSHHSPSKSSCRFFFWLPCQASHAPILSSRPKNHKPRRLHEASFTAGLTLKPLKQNWLSHYRNHKHAPCLVTIQP